MSSAEAGDAAGRVSGADGARVRRLAGDPPSPWEQEYSFSRVVAAGGWVFVGGTTSVDPSGAVIGETPYEQTVEVLAKLRHELERAGAGLGDVVSTHVYVTDISRSDEVGRAHGEVFGEVRPLMTMVEVAALIDPRMWVEIEAAAFVG
ncbi:MAG TPA: RidA family protein [Solirubrobacteraceae bacterium]|nr:RidA family protein [Solirubrobacteraceae bacterium]